MKCGITDGDQSLYLHYQLHWCLNVCIFSILFLSLFFLLMCGERLKWQRRMCRSPWQQWTPSSVPLLLLLLLCFLFYNNPPAGAESGGCAFLGSFISSSSSGSAVDCACSATLKYLRFKTVSPIFDLSDQLLCASKYRPCVDGFLWWALYRRTTDIREM